MPHADPEERRRYERAYRQRTKDARRRANKPSAAARNANRRAAERGCEGTLTPDDARAIFQRERCHWCSAAVPFLSMSIDHVVPLSAGGRNDLTNVVGSCLPCNARKGEGRHPEQWAEQHDACLLCGSDRRPHRAEGVCTTCWSGEYERRRPGRKHLRERVAAAGS